MLPQRAPLYTLVSEACAPNAIYAARGEVRFLFLLALKRFRAFPPPEYPRRQQPGVTPENSRVPSSTEHRVFAPIAPTLFSRMQPFSVVVRASQQAVGFHSEESLFTLAVSVKHWPSLCPLFVRHANCAP